MKSPVGVTGRRDIRLMVSADFEIEELILAGIPQIRRWRAPAGEIDILNVMGNSQNRP